ncbi:MAG TPA: fibronectin type III domain-containing protein [Verrucomicrobiota bacterium]|jgi:hypothetical protein|nr:fibronectin type III domain-containing protein [Verrucomicrobiota bacterium]
MTNMNAFLELRWTDRGTGITYAGSYGEINTINFGGEMDATIIEVAFHDNTSDIRLLLDPKARNWVARASYHAVVKYMNEFDGLPLDFPPEPPASVRAVAVPEGVQISWNIPVAQAGSGEAVGYAVYVSTNGYGFGRLAAISGGETTSPTLANLPADADFYVRVAAVNSGGETSPPKSSAAGAPPTWRSRACSLSTPSTVSTARPICARTWPGRTTCRRATAAPWAG